MITSPQYIQAISPYVPGKPVEELERELGIKEAVKLASNENPIGPSIKAVESIRNLLSGLNRYPDGSGYYLKGALSEKLGAGQDEIILGNGSNELLEIAAKTFMTGGDEAIMGTPSFVVYPMAVQSVGGVAVEIPLIEGRHDLTAMADALTAKTRIIFIANPNNPTGTINQAGEFGDFIERVPDNVLLVIDEAYIEYVEDNSYPDAMQYLERGNILILRTFSKIYGLAGLRIGYGIAGKMIITEMNKVRAPFNTSTVAQAAALSALEDDEHLLQSVKMNSEGKTYLYSEFERLKLDYLPTEANFIYVRLEEGTAMELYGKMLRMGVIIRPAGPDSVRITIGLPEENRLLIEALERALTIDE